jgi:hypothetical protein
MQEQHEQGDRRRGHEGQGGGERAEEDQVPAQPHQPRTPTTTQGKDGKHKNEDDDNNPLRAYQKYIQLKNQFSEAAEKLQERDKSSKKYKTLSTKTAAAVFRISDCITLEVIKRGHNTGTLKKMLHVPSFQLVCVRE